MFKRSLLSVPDVKSDSSTEDEKSIREISFYPDLGSTKRSCAEKLQQISDLISNALKTGCLVKLTFTSNGKISSMNSCSFPSNSEQSVAKFVSIVKILHILLKNHVNGVIATRRDIYYQDVNLFQSQTIVDNVIALLVKSLGFSPMELGAVAAQKGIFFGGIECVNDDNQVTAYLNKMPHTPCLIPRLNGITKIRCLEPISRIIIIEKEAVFTSLLQSHDYGGVNSNTILITGKGYPDLLTKDFVHLLMVCYPETSVVAMVDLDPFGMAIMKNYKDIQITGKSSVSHPLSVSRDALKRIKLSKLSLLRFFRDKGDECLDLNLRDFNMAKSLIADFDTNFDRFDVEDVHFLEECQRMMFFQKKAELDLVGVGGLLQAQGH
ncbi:hypothetical protein WICPIJ_006994 [Wickerhamomyces pijperi]|uniref:DNA topoisomerase (ATP-hydrolyzing) n=1 Tax=Wickerhamomyces pijperi TaxID=599730 RepID=A0A9P8Q115_WICPI|nr:hypothetical protein WICPIJ_006994 [Wickerhamomyces pijperi]